MLTRRLRAALLARAYARALACVLGCMLMGAGLAEPRRAHAQVVLSGQWRSGATAIDVQVESWGSDCGPAPKSSQSAGGGVVRVVQLGEQLQLHSGNRVIKSDVCFGQNPSLKRKSATVNDHTWVTRCETPMDDPRAETGVYTLKLLSADRLLYQDVSRFRWQLKNSLCVATITTVQTLTRMSDADLAQSAKAAPAPPATTTPTPATTKKTPPAPPKPPALPQSVAAAPAKAEPPPCVPGEPARLALAPRRPRIELGERFCFRTRVVDAAGCRLPPMTPSWSLDAGPARSAKLDARGCFEASAQAADGEGTFRVIASVATPKGGALRAEAVVEVVAADLSGLVAKRLLDDEDENGALEAELEAQTGAPPPAEAVAATSHTATRAVGTEAPVKRPAWIWPAIGAVLALLGGAIALVARRRTRASVAPEPAPAYREGSLDRRAAPSAPIASKPAAPVAPVAPKPSEPAKAAAQPAELRCPTCGAVYPPGSAFCGSDGTPLKT